MKPSLDTWTTFFLLAAGQGIFLAILLFTNKKGNLQANKILGLFILLFAITLIDYVGYWTNYNWTFPYLAGIYEPLVFLMGPLLFLYFKSIEEDDAIGGKDWLHFVPFVLYSLYKIPYFTLPLDSKLNLLQGNFDKVEWSLLFKHPFPNFVAIVTISHLTVYAIVIFLYLRTKRKQFVDSSDEANKNIRDRWYQTLQYLYFGFVVSYLIYYILVRTPYFTLFYDYSISLAMTVFIYTVGYLGYKQPEIFSGQVLKHVFLAPKYQNSTLTQRASQSLLEKLLEYMEEQKPYLDNELRLSGLAEQLQLSTHHLSQVINEQLGKTFSDFINEYRVKEVRRMLEDPKCKDMYVINIAYSSGFNNKTSFNKAFKEQAGMSPSQYRKQALGKGERSAFVSRESK